MAYIIVEVTTKDGYETNNSGIPMSDVTNVDASYAGANSEGMADTCTSPAPPIAKKRGPGRQKKNRAKPPAERSGKATRQALCKGCGEHGHRQGSWRCSLTGTKKR